MAIEAAVILKADNRYPLRICFRYLHSLLSITHKKHFLDVLIDDELISDGFIINLTRFSQDVFEDVVLNSPSMHA